MATREKNRTRLPKRTVRKLCFTMALDASFAPGAVGTIRSIRKFYAPDEADIVVFLDRMTDPFTRFCTQMQAELHHFEEIWPWLRPLVYEDPCFAHNARHYYHPDFQPAPGLDCALDRSPLGFGTLRHLHPLNVKAYCTGYCLCVRDYHRVVHIDADAFLLAPLDALLGRHHAPDTVVACDDGRDPLENLEALFGVSKPSDFSDALYAFNAGLVLYVNGPGVRALMRDFMFYIESCYHYRYSAHFADQGVLRALVAKHHINQGIRFELEDGATWNPTFLRADDLQYNADQQTWTNLRTGHRQHVWHSAGAEKLWTGRYESPSVNDAWRWVGGSYGDEWIQTLEGVKP